MGTATKPWPRWWLSCAFLAILAGAACQPREPAPALRLPERGGELRVLLPGEPRGLDPNDIRDEIAQLIAPNLFSALVTLDTEGRLLPDLAERWETADGGRTYTFHLRPGVRWHDGRDFGSGDVRFTVERLKSLPSLSQEAVRRIVRVDTPDELTAVFRLEEPWAPFLTSLAWGGTYILPRHLAGADGALPLDARPVGTGPFRLREWVRGERIVLEAGPRFHRPGPLLDRVVYGFAPDNSRAAERILRGEADHLLTRVPPELVPRLQRSRDVRVVTSPTYSRIYCAFNLHRPPLGDRRVREAVNRALDRGEVVRQALLGYGVPGFGFYTPSVAWAYNGDAHVPEFDPERARQLLDEAGLAPDARGVRAEMEMVLVGMSPLPALGELVRQRLREIGIEVRLTTLPFPEWIDRVVRRQDFDLTVMSGSHGPDPENLGFRFSSRSPHRAFGYASPELEAALAEGARTLDLPRRARAYHRVQEILARDLPIAPLAEGIHFTVFRRHVRGLSHAEARGLVPIHELSLARVRP